jgi:hypothetical protein
MFHESRSNPETMATKPIVKILHKTNPDTAPTTSLKQFHKLKLKHSLTDTLPLLQSDQAQKKTFDMKNRVRGRSSWVQSGRGRSRQKGKRN